jgi:hypothetical protein
MRGNTYTDPIDGKSYRRFLPYGYAKVRENVLAPGTLSLERHRLFWLYLKNETAFFSAPLRVLHFAPEQAFVKKFKKQKKPNIYHHRPQLSYCRCKSRYLRLAL